MPAILKLNQKRLYEQAKSLQSQNDVIVVVKNDAYNFGMHRAFEAFFKAGIRSYATTNLKEAVWLRKQNKEIMILLLDPSIEFETLRQHDITLTIPNIAFYDQYKQQIQGLNVQLTYKNLLNRFGFDTSEEMSKALDDHSITVTGIWTHFAYADELRDPRYEIEKKNWFSILNDLSPYLDQLHYIHSQNSASYVRDGLLEGNSHIRPGVIAYGTRPYISDTDYQIALPQQTIEVSATVKDIIQLKKGQSAGYSAAFTAEKDTTLAICDIGYGNGILRKRSNHKVLINQHHYAIAVLMMSHMMVEIDEQVSIGDTVYLYNDQLRLDIFAQKGVGSFSEQMSGLNHQTFELKEVKLN